MFFVLVFFRISDFVVSFIGLTFFNSKFVESNVFGFTLGLHAFNVIGLVMLGLLIFLIRNDLVLVKYVASPAVLFLIFYFAFIVSNNVAVILR